MAISGYSYSSPRHSRTRLNLANPTSYLLTKLDLTETEFHDQSLIQWRCR